MSLVLAFLDDPSAQPDAGCFDDAELRFLVGPPAEVALESATRTDQGAGLTIGTVRPVDWQVGGLGGDQYRQDSFLDPTQLFQLVGDDGLHQGLLAFVEDQNRVSLSPPHDLGDDEVIGSVAVAELDPGWRRRSGRSDTVAVEWFEIGIDRILGMVVLVAAVDEIDDLITTVVGPALAGFEIDPG
jgi:hypothetical protein